ncbi:MAG: NAD(P)/FAD-dependent oxidoreductase [Nitrososphaerales archaeon]
MKDKYDVLIVGAGPAGSAASIKCVEEGLNTLLVEKGGLGRHKPCAGVLPPVASYVLDELGLHLSDNVLSDPPKLKVFYVPPSGRANGGELRNYFVFNLDRDLFDRWLAEKAVERGVNLQTNTNFITLEQGAQVEAILETKGNIQKVEVEYIVGADGANSKVRRCLKDAPTQKLLTVIQESWEGYGEFEDSFYTILNRKITPTYGYLLKKRGTLLIGTGAKDSKLCVQSLEALKSWLKSVFNFKPNKMIKREVGFLPYGECFIGCGNVMLIGDAAGLCNRFSGEGIRFALESGLTVAESIKDAKSGCQALEIYKMRAQPILDFVEKTANILEEKDDKWREEFVLTELRRSNLW